MKQPSHIRVKYSDTLRELDRIIDGQQCTPVGQSALKNLKIQLRDLGKQIEAMLTLPEAAKEEDGPHHD